MARGSPPTRDERDEAALAKALYLDASKPMTLNDIAAQFGRSIGWILHIKDRDEWPERPPTGKQTKPASIVVTDIDRKLHGDLADDVIFLRSACGFLVARFKGDYRINSEVVSAAELRQRASLAREARDRQQPAAPAQTSAAPAERPKAKVLAPASPAFCGCGQLSSHGGRCWFRRGLSGPSASAAAAPKPARDDALIRRVDTLERQITTLRRILGLLVRQDRQAIDGRLQSLAKIEAQLAAAQSPAGG